MHYYRHLYILHNMKFVVCERSGCCVGWAFGDGGTDWEHLQIWLLPSAPDQRHSPFLERHGSPVGSTGVHHIEGWLLQLRSPRIERHHGRPSAALDERGRSTHSEATKVFAHRDSDEGWSALASCPKADSVQDPADDMEVYFRKCPWLSPGTLQSPLHNTGMSSASIDGDKSLPAQRTQGQDSYNAKEGFRPRGST